MTTGARPRVTIWCLSVAAFAILFAGGVARSEESKDDRASVIAETAIRARLGDEVFDRYLSPEGTNVTAPATDCSTRPGGCDDVGRQGYSQVEFRLRVPGAPFVDAIVWCTVKNDGGVADLWGVPNCASDPKECVFPYDEVAARAIAAKAGLEPGIRPWTGNFTWNGNFKSYVWVVSNTLREDESEGGGRLVTIDANDGRVLEVLNWTRVS